MYIGTETAAKQPLLQACVCLSVCLPVAALRRLIAGDRPTLEWPHTKVSVTLRLLRFAAILPHFPFFRTFSVIYFLLASLPQLGLRLQQPQSPLLFGSPFAFHAGLSAAMAAVRWVVQRPGSNLAK